MNFAAIDATLAGPARGDVPTQATSTFERPPVVPADAPDFVQRVTAEIIAGQGDELPVSLMPRRRHLAHRHDASGRSATSRWRSRSGRRTSASSAASARWSARTRPSAPRCTTRPARQRRAGDLQAHADQGQGLPGPTNVTYQVAPEDCTGCGLCVEVCPAKDKQGPAAARPSTWPAGAAARASSVPNWDFFLSLPEYDRAKLDGTKIKGAS
jgi:pyruvate-ferredoxin/flavodoxin oxidoreductase